MAEFMIGDRVVIIGSEGKGNDMPEWVGMTGTVVKPDEALMAEYSQVLRENAMVYIEPDQDRPDMHSKARFLWPTSGLKSLFEEVTEEEVQMAIQSIKEAL